jgi:hypothetical protein
MSEEYNRSWNIALERAAKIAREHKSGPEYGRLHIRAQNETCDQIAKLILSQRRSFMSDDTSDPIFDEMIEALGAFVTEVGEVEHVMFETILAVAEEDANDVHGAFYSEPFGPKVTMLEKRLEHSAFDEYRAGLDHLIMMLRTLIPQRNSIIHGETFQITRKNETKVFRVGFTRRNLTPWKDFNFEGDAENIFTSDQIKHVISDCIAIKTDLDLIRQKVIKNLTGHQPPYLSHLFEID